VAGGYLVDHVGKPDQIAGVGRGLKGFLPKMHNLPSIDALLWSALRHINT